jgi:hypothetical protein
MVHVTKIIMSKLYLDEYSEKTNFTKTQNNVLISSDVLSDECMIEIEKLVAYYIDQRKTMDLTRRQ